MRKRRENLKAVWIFLIKNFVCLVTRDVGIAKNIDWQKILIGSFDRFWPFFCHGHV
jgi:hypothetical protein